MAGAGSAPGVVDRGADVTERGGDVRGVGCGDARGAIVCETTVELAQQARLGVKDPEEGCPADAGVRADVLDGQLVEGARSSQVACGVIELGGIALSAARATVERLGRSECHNTPCSVLRLDSLKRN